MKVFLTLLLAAFLASTSGCFGDKEVEEAVESAKEDMEDAKGEMKEKVEIAKSEWKKKIKESCPKKKFKAKKERRKCIKELKKGFKVKK